MLVISTLPHLATILYSPDLHYATIVFYSTLSSALWHMEGSDFTILAIIDYSFALAWFTLDCYYSHQSNKFRSVLLLNILVAALNPIISPYNYEYTHSLWHLLSATKAFYVAKELLKVESDADENPR